MSTLTGTGKLVRLILRRDRVLLPLWVVLLGTFPVSLTRSLNDLYPTVAERQRYIEETASNPSYVALFGPVFGDDPGALGAQRASDVLVFVALASLLTVIRHTRAEEEAGRRELLAATPLGRLAPITAVLAVTLVANLVLGAIVAFGLISLDLSASGSYALGLSMFLCGAVFAAVGAVAAQLSPSARTARGIALGALAAAFLLRMAGDSGTGDSGPTVLSWLSPIGWLQRTRPFADERWWVFLLPIAFAAVLVAVAGRLSARRDIGAGLLPERLGPPVASPALRGPLALGWRLQRGSLVAWSLGFVLAGALFGGVAKDAGESVADNEGLRDIVTRMGGGGDFSDAYLAAITGVIGLISAAYAVQTVIRLRAEETGQLAEPVLATAVTRLRWAGGHLAFTLLGPTVALVCYGVSAGITYGASTGGVGEQLPRVLGGAVAYLPAVWTIAAVAVVLFGLLPRFTATAWGVLALCLVFGQFGAALQFDQWLLDLSPFTHIPRLPGSDMTAVPLVALAAIALALAAAGLGGLRRRDIPIG